jgi:hypothetical protein
MRKVFSEAVSEEDLVAVAKAMTEKAKEGDVAAARLALSYVVGKPLDAVEPDSLDLAELKQYEEETQHFKALPTVAATPDLEMVCTIARASRPEIAEAASKDISHALLHGELPEGSPFLGPDSLECQEASDSDNPPLENGDIGAPQSVASGAVPGIEGHLQGQELLQALGIPTASTEGPATPAAAAGPQVDANVVAAAILMLYEATLAANGGNNPFLALAEAPDDQQGAPGAESMAAPAGGSDRPGRSPNAGNGPDASPGPRRRRA